VRRLLPHDATVVSPHASNALRLAHGAPDTAAVPARSPWEANVEDHTQRLPQMKYKDGVGRHRLTRSWGCHW
jgi:hypothetical protein